MRRRRGHTKTVLLVGIMCLGFATAAFGKPAYHWFKSRLNPSPYPFTVPGPPPPPSSFPAGPITTPPEAGGITFGAHAGEVCELLGMSSCNIPTLSDPSVYGKYREAINSAYGVDLLDMNYWRVGSPEDGDRSIELAGWIENAGEYGPVTLALEPASADYAAIFADNAEMQAMRRVFVKHPGKIWIRFASEANLRLNPYSVFNSRAKCQEYIDAARWFADYMPDNVKLVFCPLINTAVLPNAAQQETMQMMFLGPDEGEIPWDAIGGTLYRTDVSLNPTYTRYYEMMSEWNTDLPFQLCELGGPYGKRDEMIEFIESCIGGEWPRLEKINLFARAINQRADPEGTFGFVDPAMREKAKSGPLSEEERTAVRSYIAETLAP